MNFTGSKYADLGNNRYNRAFIAKLIRADIKTAKANGELPANLKVSVRKTGHNSIGIELDLPGKNIAPGFTACVALGISPFTSDIFRVAEYTPEMRAAIRTVEAIANEYNYDRSDSTVDYFDTNFYLSTTVKYDQVKADREKWKAENKDLLEDLKIAYTADRGAFYRIVERMA